MLDQEWLRQIIFAECTRLIRVHEDDRFQEHNVPGCEHEPLRDNQIDGEYV